MDSNKTKVFVTGISGFIATHIAKLLIEQNSHVIGTVRSLKDSKKTEFLKELSEKGPGTIVFEELELEDSQEKWNKIFL